MRNCYPQQKRLITSTEKPIEFFLIRSVRRRTIEIQIKGAGAVHVRAPFKTDFKEIEEFVLSKQEWIFKQAKRLKKRSLNKKEIQYKDGEFFLFLGKRCSLHVQEFSAKRTRIDYLGDRWAVSVAKNLSEQEKQTQVKKKLWSWYEDQARELFASRLFYFTKVMDENVQEILIRKQKSVWGTCHKWRKLISLNWLLIQAPLWVIDYVIIHELSHLKHANHSQRFWNRVKKFCPDYQRAKNWLKENQSELTLT